MSHYITVPLNENGVITDDYIQDELRVVCAQRFGITDVFLYSHGWWTSADAASDLDFALQRQFPLAKTINIFAKNRDRVALGANGPTDAVKQRFGGCYDLVIDPGFTHGDFKPKGQRLVCADITPLHKDREANGAYKGDSFAGHHADVNIAELYELLAAFLFQ